MSQEFNGFDEIGKAPDTNEMQHAEQLKIDKRNHLHHRVFAQSESGRELLGLWKEQLAMIPTLDSHSTQFAAGMNEGEKNFVRSIINIINQVEEK